MGGHADADGGENRGRSIAIRVGWRRNGAMGMGWRLDQIL